MKFFNFKPAGRPPKNREISPIRQIRIEIKPASAGFAYPPLCESPCPHQNLPNSSNSVEAPVPVMALFNSSNSVEPDCL